MSTVAKPPTVVPGSGAGVGASATILVGGSDGDGIVEVVAGLTGLTPDSKIFTLTYGEPYDPTMATQVTVLPANGEAAEVALAIVPSMRGDYKIFDLVGTKILLTPGATLRYSYAVVPVLP